MTRKLPSKILIADDHALYRSGLASLLDAISSDIKIVEAASYPEAIRAANEIKDLDLVLCDLGMPGMERFAGLSALVRSLEEVPVVVVSAAESSEDMGMAMDCGAHGYIPKTLDSKTVVTAVEKVIGGDIYLPPTLMGWQPGQGVPVSGEGPHLTPRQRDVLNLMADGKSNKEIARILGLAEGTIKLHVTGLLKVLDANNRTQAVIKATALGLARGPDQECRRPSRRRAGAPAFGPYWAPHCPAPPRFAWHRRPGRPTRPWVCTTGRRSGRSCSPPRLFWSASSCPGG